MNPVNIIPFDNQYADDFYKLNIEWLSTYFYVEPFDENVLSRPNTYIINKGGHIFFAQRESTILGTVALMPTANPLVFELTIMAVLPDMRGQKIGQKLLKFCIAFAKKQQWEALMLYSATKLENAIYIYRKYGFKELPLETNSPYRRSDIKMELRLK